MWTLRAAHPVDVESIAELWWRGWRDGHLGHVPEALLRHRQLESFRVRVPERIAGTTVATLGANLLGFVTVLEDELEQLYVTEHARGTGLAAALLRHGETEIAQRFELAWLAAAAGNARARRFYVRQGWRDAGPFDYSAQVEGGSIIVPCHRYEKRVAGGR